MVSLLPTGWVGVSIMSPAGTELPALPRAWQHAKLSDVSLGTHLRYSLVADKDVKKSNKQTTKSCVSFKTKPFV